MSKELDWYWIRGELAYRRDQRRMKQERLQRIEILTRDVKCEDCKPIVAKVDELEREMEALKKKVEYINDNHTADVITRNIQNRTRF